MLYRRLALKKTREIQLVQNIGSLWIPWVTLVLPELHGQFKMMATTFEALCGPGRTRAFSVMVDIQDWESHLRVTT